MPVTGAKPKENKINRTPAVHDWIEVEDVPYTGGPTMGLAQAPAATRRWWKAVSTMPHCIRWRQAEWEFALMTARIHAAVINGDLTRAQELRVREKAMGTTDDARRDLRIRYVPVQVEAATENPGRVTDFDAERRRRLLEVEE